MNKNERDEDGEEDSSSYEDDDDEEEELPNEIDDDDNDDDESESASNRYGIMNTNYGSDPTTIVDDELNTIPTPNETSDSQTKVQQWRQRNRSQSLGSSNSSLDRDQALPTEDQNHLIRRKHPS